jgi:hypothetical protein
MIFGHAPTFDFVMKSILELEQFLNKDPTVAQTLAVRR